MKGRRNPLVQRPQSPRAETARRGRPQSKKTQPAAMHIVGVTGDARYQLPDCYWQLGALTLLPEQFFSPGTQSFALWTGERRLLLAVLEDAVNSFLKYRVARSRRGQRLFAETLDWFWSREQRWLYSFASICRHLGLDADYIRGGLSRIIMPDETVAKHPLVRRMSVASRRTFAQAA